MATGKRLLYPITEPFICEYINVSSIHNIYYEVSGNPKGEAVLFLHGGPGSGCNPWVRGWFNPKIYKIVLIDQRGSGKSQPNAEIKENTTQDLINDIETIRKQLKIRKWKIIFGGSWGSCLALAYLNYIYSVDYNNDLESIEYVILYGIFFGRRKEIENTYSSTGPAALLYPDAYYDFLEPIRLLDDKYKENNQSVVDLYSKIFKNENNQFSNEFVSNAIMKWSQWESRISSALRTPKHWKELDESWLSDLNKLKSHSILENHYFMNNCWCDGNIFSSDEYAKKLKDNNVKIRIVTGRFDVVCPPSTAYELYSNLKKNHVDSSLQFITPAGHTALDEEVTKVLLQLLNP